MIERKRQEALQRRAAAAAAAATDGQETRRIPSPGLQQEMAAQVAVEAKRTQEMLAVSRHLSKMDRRPASQVPAGVLRARSEVLSWAGPTVAFLWLEQQQQERDSDSSA